MRGPWICGGVGSGLTSLRPCEDVGSSSSSRSMTRGLEEVVGVCSWLRVSLRVGRMAGVPCPLRLMVEREGVLALPFLGGLRFPMGGGWSSFCGLGVSPLGGEDGSIASTVGLMTASNETDLLVSSGPRIGERVPSSNSLSVYRG